MFINFYLFIDIRFPKGFCNGNEDSGHVETQMAKRSKQALAKLLTYVQSSLQMGYIPHNLYNRPRNIMLVNSVSYGIMIGLGIQSFLCFIQDVF